MNFFDRIEELRKAHNLSQGKLEELLGFSNGSINKWKTSVPKADRLQKIADYFGVTIDYLMSGRIMGSTEAAEGTMSTFERIKMLCDSNGISIKQLEQNLNYGNGSLAKSETIKANRLSEIADYFGVSMDYLYDGKQANWQPTISEKDEKDIKKKLDALLAQLCNDTGLMYDGEPMDEESIDAVRAALEVAERTAMLEARRKFTPDKYKK